MKKLNLQLGSIKEMLTKEQMKKVAGGYSSCYVVCRDADVHDLGGSAVLDCEGDVNELVTVICSPYPTAVVGYCICNP